MKKLILVLILIIGWLGSYGQKIEDLTRATTATKTDLLIIDQSDATKGIAIEHLFSGDSLFLPDLATSETKVLSPTSTGGTKSLETSGVTDITLASISVDSVGVNAYLIVDGIFNYAADAQANDDYEIDIPGITALVAGLQVTFLANTANTGGATLEITSVGDLDAILKNHDVALATGDIEAGQIVVCIFDGTSWQMTSQLA